MTLRLLLLASLLTGCTGFGDFEVVVPISEQRVEGSPLGGVLGGVLQVPIPLDVDLEAETRARNTGPVQRVRLAALVLDITTTEEPPGDADDFDFLDRATIFVERADGGSSPPRVRVATLDPVPSGARQISFDVDSSIDLRPYVEAGARLTSDASGTVPPDHVTYDGRVVLSLEVL